MRAKRHVGRIRNGRFGLSVKPESRKAAWRRAAADARFEQLCLSDARWFWSALTEREEKGAIRTRDG
ncbi:hypothetical protein NDU88_010084 [Pleurodeles waltl]|uniref:Uncharacterized protein n=1 Tax=Pleurodeles waltl TaxID=8319 RepID=A0AAV7RX34_PLEWA|nr:hypothetical protein NDU88_010084 [Pleurodeles waltl]